MLAATSGGEGSHHCSVLDIVLLSLRLHPYRWSFNLTLLITGIFALAAGGAANEVALCSLIGMYAVGSGGNLPVDSAVFLEFVPATHQWLLTVLSIWWAIGQLVGALVSLD